ncbi:hypothetical protein IAT38_005325 [Cryptococcus sp. DSM 104549]
MSFGRPGFGDAFKPSPPVRGSFPLDHDGECKSFMMDYIKCLRANASDNGQCRLESKKYLQCRMDNGLMTKDDMTNLGLGDVAEPGQQNKATSGAEATAAAVAVPNAASLPQPPPPETQRRI